MNFNFEWVNHIPKDHSIGDVQIRELFKWASSVEGNAIEIGSFYGRSTVVIAAGLKVGSRGKVFAIDPHKNRYGSFEKCVNNINQSGFSDHVEIVRGKSEDVLKSKTPKELFQSNIGLLFIDGNHTYEGIKIDLQWIKLVNRGGVILFHDYSVNKYPGIVRAITEYQETHNTMSSLQLLGSMIIFKRI